MSQTIALEFSAQLQWINAEPQILAAHRGRVVALVFWNASSVYCHNVLDFLGGIQRKFPDQLSVLCIHQAKFSAELEQHVLEEAIQRLDIQMPVANDPAWVTWQHYGIQSWPSIVLINAESEVMDVIVGDDQQAQLEKSIGQLVATLAVDSTPKSKSLQVKPKIKSFNAMHYPSALMVHNNCLYVADTGHHRILECALDGKVIRIFGNGLPLLLDGSSSDACFNRPQGLCIDRDYLYVADTGNHAIRRVRLHDGSVDTLIGNGRAGSVRVGKLDKDNRYQLNNPSAVSVSLDTLVFTDSGSNALWQVNLNQMQLTHLAGDGQLGLSDGIGLRAQLAHPLALVGSKNNFYIAEGASSSIRTVALPEGRVNTIIGQGLFQFGMQDGPRKKASLQHPSALALDEKRNMLWIADTYNHKIRALHLINNELSTVSLMQNLVHPCGLALNDDSLWIADSATHHIYRYYVDSELLTRVTIRV